MELIWTRSARCSIISIYIYEAQFHKFHSWELSLSLRKHFWDEPFLLQLDIFVRIVLWVNWFPLFRSKFDFHVTFISYVSSAYIFQTPHAGRYFVWGALKFKKYSANSELAKDCFFNSSIDYSWSNTEPILLCIPPQMQFRIIVT